MLLIRLGRSANTPHWIGVNLDEAQYVAKKCINVPRIRRLVGFRDDRPIGCWLDVQEWMPRRDIRDRRVYGWPHETTHFSRRRQAPALFTTGRSGRACGAGFIPCYARWYGGELPDEACIFVEDSIVVEGFQNHEPLGCWMRLLPVLDDGGDQLIFFLSVRLELGIGQQGECTYQDYCGNDASRACPSRRFHVDLDRRGILRLRK